MKGTKVVGEESNYSQTVDRQVHSSELQTAEKFVQEDEGMVWDITSSQSVF